MANFAFIDGQNVHLGITALGWKLDWRKFRVHLEEHYGVGRAYYFIGYMPDHQRMYIGLQNAGYTLIFKEVTYRVDGSRKGNVDAELVLQVMLERPHYDRAVIATSDGDFAGLVRYLSDNDKLERVLSPHRRGCSALLKRAAREKIDFLEDAKAKIAYKQ